MPAVMTRNTKHMSARTAGGRRLPELQRTAAVELHRERMAINASARRIARTHKRGDREICTSSLCKLRRRTTEYNRRAMQLWNAADQGDNRSNNATSSTANTTQNETNSEDNTPPSKDWQKDLAAAIIAMFNEYLKNNKPPPESKHTPASGTTAPLIGTIKTQPNPAKTEPFTQWLLERTPPRKLAGGKLERNRTTQDERMLQEALKNRATAYKSHPTRPPDVPEVNYAAALLNAKEQDKAVIDGGCTIFMSPHRRHFIQHTLRPTLQRIIGVDGVPVRADAEGYAQVAFADHRTRKICRATMQGLLTEKAHPSGLTLISYPQWQREEGVGLKNPTDPSEPAILHTGENESSVEFLVDYDQGGLLTVPLLNGDQLLHRPTTKGIHYGRHHLPACGSTRWPRTKQGSIQNTTHLDSHLPGRRGTPSQRTRDARADTARSSRASRRPSSEETGRPNRRGCDQCG